MNNIFGQGQGGQGCQDGPGGQNCQDGQDCQARVVIRGRCRKHFFQILTTGQGGQSDQGVQGQGQSGRLNSV